MKGEPKYYYLKTTDKDKPYIRYPFKKGELREYETVCGLVEGWGGVPCDVIWAKSTKVYQEAEIKYKESSL